MNHPIIYVYPEGASMNLSDKQQSGVVVYHSSPLLSRALAKWQIQREQRHSIKINQKRVKMIDGKLRAIDTEKGDLLRRVVSSKLELIEILALRNTYEKEITANPTKDERGRQARFETLTKQFIDQHLDEYLTQKPDASSQNIADERQYLQLILADVFALDNAGRNQLVLGFSNYSRLYNEKQSLLAAH